jgi:pyrroline-5-carboxylate reductase
VPRRIEPNAHALIDAGLNDLVVDAHELASRAQLVLYAVRPQDHLAIAGLELDPEALLVSFLAGIPLEMLPVRPSLTRKARLMTSTPDTLLAADAIAATYPPGDRLVGQLCHALGARVFELTSESDFSAFTALGPCLPVALTVCEGMGRVVDEAEIVDLATTMGLKCWDDVVRWARERQPRGLTSEQRDSYVDQASTPGGVTESVVRALKSGLSLTNSLRCGVARSDEMAGS